MGCSHPHPAPRQQTDGTRPSRLLDAGVLLLAGTMLGAAACAAPASTPTAIAPPVPVSVSATVVGSRESPTIGAADARRAYPGPRPPPAVERDTPAKLTSTAQGVQLVTLGTAIATAARPGESIASYDYIAVFIVLAAPPVGGLRLTPDPAEIVGTDSIGGRYPASYTELASDDGLTLAGVSFRGASRGPKTFGLQVGAVTRVQGGGTPIVLRGPWTVEVVTQLVDEPSGSLLESRPGRSPAEVDGATIQFAPVRTGPTDNLVSFTVERSAGPETIYATVGPGGDIRKVAR